MGDLKAWKDRRTRGTAKARLRSLILAGGRDTKFQAAAERLAAAIGPSATVAWVPDAGHAAHLEAPAAFAAMVRPFLLADPAPVTGLHHPTP